MNTLFEQIVREVLPPKIAWHLTRRRRERRQLDTLTSFYRQFVAPGDLCFDIGANLGNRTRCFQKIGCKVVAVEPQERCFRKLEREFGRSNDVSLVNSALGRTTGRCTLHISPDHVLSSTSETFVERTSTSGRFSSSKWDRTQIVPMTTIDNLIAIHGLPSFIKIDVEGSESEVLAGLSVAVAALSFEWTPEFPENAISSIDHLSSLGPYEFNLSWGETMCFSRPQWRTPASIKLLVEEFRNESTIFGDIYARLPQTTTER